MSFLRERWPMLVGWSTAAALFAGAFGLGRWSAPRPRVEIEQLHQLELHQVALRGSSFDRSAGPVRVVERWRSAPAAPGCPAVRERERVVERGSVVEHAAAAEAAGRTETVRDVVHLVESPRPRWALAGGLQLVPEVAPMLELGVRVAGPVWLEVWTVPRLALALPAAGAAVRVEW